MTPTHKNHSATRKRLLEEACRVFSEVGFHEGTVGRICDAAGANRAAVNYYFGDKESLYGEVWRHAWEIAKEAYPLEPAEKRLLPAERLRHFMRSLVLRVFDSGPPGCFVRLMAFEITDPQEFMEKERGELRREHDSRFESIVRELLGEGAGEEDLTVCRLMVLVPSLGIGIRRFGRHARPHMPHARLEFDPEEMAERMSEFALAGIENLRNSIEIREAAGREATA